MAGPSVRARLVLSAITLSSVSAEAQTIDQTVESAPPSGIQDIVITAQRRSELAQRVPITVETLKGDLLAKTGIKDLFQAVTLVPGVIFSRAPDDGLALTFRGLGTAARSQAFEQSVAVYNDGVFLGKPRLYSTGLFDVERIEFIKGTQSTLMGKNASIGAINIIDTQPGRKFTYNARAGYELVDGGYSLDGAATVPLASSASARIAIHDNDLNGWVRNDRTSHLGPEHKDLGARGTLAVEPASGLKLTLFDQYADNEQIGASYQLVGGNLPPVYGESRLDGHNAQYTTATSNGDTNHRTRSNIASLKAEFQLGDNTLVAQTAEVTYRLRNIDDFDFSVDDAINFDRRERYRQFTQEVRFQSPSDLRLNYMLGIFYLSSRWHSIEHQDWHVPNFPPAGPPGPGQLFNGPFTDDFLQRQSAYSGFVSATWRFARHARLAGGVRYTAENKNVVFSRVAEAPFTVWNTIANPQFDSTNLYHASRHLDGNLSLQYDLGPRTMLYASAGQGSKSGGFAETNTIAVNPAVLVNGKVPPSLVAAGDTLKDEVVRSYELGLKTSLFDQRLRLNLALFETDIRNFQDTIFTGGTLGFITFNSPARSRGVEVEAAYQPTSELRFDGGVTYVDATMVFQPIDPATNAPKVDPMGNPLYARFRRSQAPRLIVNAGGTWRGSLSSALNDSITLAVRHRSSMYNQEQVQFLSKPLTTFEIDLGIESKDHRWGADLVAKNITNASAEDFASPSVDPRFAAFYGAHLGGPNQLRTVMVSVHFAH